VNTTKPAKNLREQQKEYTKTRLMEAARDLLSTRGYVALTVDDIVAEAGASRATFYLHFHGKAEVAVAVAEAHREETRRWYPVLDDVLASGSPDALRQWFASIVRYYEDHAAVIIALREAAYVEDSVRHDFIKFVKQATDLMPSYFARWPGDRQEEALLRVQLMIFQFDHFLERHAEIGEFTGETIARTLTDIWWPALDPVRAVPASVS
jgi:AcrR family transcriptional regulator